MDQSQISRYKTLDFFARQVVEGFITGRHKSPFHGFSVEFSDYRQYNPGESTRNIDWHLYGRTNRLYVKQFEEETNLRCQLVVDRSASMLFPLERHADPEHPNKLTFAVYAAAVLIELLHRQRDAFGLTLLGPAPFPTSDLYSQLSTLNSQLSTHTTPCRSSTLHQRHLLAQLDNLLSSPTQIPKDSKTQELKDSKTQRLKDTETDLTSQLHLLAEQLHRRSLVVLFTDALSSDSNNQAIKQSNSDNSSNQAIKQSNNIEPLLDALRHLRHNRHEVILFHTYDLAHEVNLDYDARPHRFIDLESGRQLRLQPTEVADAYRRQMEADFALLARRAMQYRIDYVPVDVAQGFHQVIQPFLLKRSKQR